VLETLRSKGEALFLDLHQLFIFIKSSSSSSLHFVPIQTLLAADSVEEAHREHKDCGTVKVKDGDFGGFKQRTNHGFGGWHRFEDADCLLCFWWQNARSEDHKESKKERSRAC